MMTTAHVGRRRFLAAVAAAAAAPGLVGATRAVRVSDPPGSRIIAADQASRRVLLLDPAAVATRSLLAPRWSWAPGDGLADLRPDLTWRNVSDAKWVGLPGSAGVLCCASEGLAALVALADGAVRWAVAVPHANLHSVELLSDGSVAVCASTAGWVRVYAAALGPRCGQYTEFALPGAHGLHWDQRGGVLWALGDHDLVALTVGLTVGDVRGLASLAATARYPLPDPGGHDLAAAGPGSDRLWVTTNAHVHQFSTSQAVFVPYPEHGLVDRPQVKSVGTDPVTGRILLATPAADNPCTWCTSTVELVGPAGQETVQGSSLYKARWAVPAHSTA